MQCSPFYDLNYLIKLKKNLQKFCDVLIENKLKINVIFFNKKYKEFYKF